jgi:hypothetical protein
MYQGPDKEHSVNPDYELVRDYSALNKAALEAGMTSAKEQARFRYFYSLEIVHFIRFFLHRTVHDIKKKVFIRDVSRSKKTRKFSDDMVFGTPNR